MSDRILKKNPGSQVPNDAALFGRIVDILEEARSHIARTVNSAMVVAYWLIGREIIEEEQKGRKRADYGKAVIENLSRRLTGRYGKGLFHCILVEYAEVLSNIQWPHRDNSFPIWERIRAGKDSLPKGKRIG